VNRRGEGQRAEQPRGWWCVQIQGLEVRGGIGLSDLAVVAVRKNARDVLVLLECNQVFATTHWSVVRTAGDPAPTVAQEALAVQQRTRRIMIADMPDSPREDRLGEPTRRP